MSGMVVLKGIAVWSVETLLELSLLGFYLATLPGHDMHELGKNILLYFSGMLFFFIRGYLLPTGIIRAIWRSRVWWSYPAIATALFLICFGVTNAFVIDSVLIPTDKLHFLLAGSLIAFASTTAGTFALNKWVAA